MRKGSILIIDDDPVTLDVLGDALLVRLINTTVDVTASPRDALARMARQDYDTILSDFKMPGLDGLELLGHIRVLRPYTPTVLMTGHLESDLQRRALAAGAYAFIQKPLDRDRLVRILKKALCFRHSGL